MKFTLLSGHFEARRLIFIVEIITCTVYGSGLKIKSLIKLKSQENELYCLFERIKKNKNAV